MLGVVIMKEKKDYNMQIRVKKDFADYFKQTADYKKMKYGQFLEMIFNNYMKEDNNNE